MLLYTTLVSCMSIYNTLASLPHTKYVQGDDNLMNHYIIWLATALCKWSFCVRHRRRNSLLSVFCIKVRVQEKETGIVRVHSFYFLHF